MLRGEGGGEEESLLLQWLARGGMSWMKVFMEGDVFIFFVKAILWKLCMVGGRLWEHSERESTQRDEGGGGREEDTGGLKVSSIIWDELNMSVIPNSKLPILFINVAF